MSSQTTQEALEMLMQLMDELQGRLIAEKSKEGMSDVPTLTEPPSMDDAEKPTDEMAGVDSEGDDEMMEDGTPRREYIRSKLGLGKSSPGKSIDMGFVGVSPKKPSMASPSAAKPAEPSKPSFFKRGK